MAYWSKWKGEQIDDAVGTVIEKEEAWDGKQDKLEGRYGQLVGFDSYGNAVAQDVDLSSIGGGGEGGGDLSNVIRMEGGAVATLEGNFGSAPYVIEFIEDDESNCCCNGGGGGSGSGDGWATTAGVISFNGRDGKVIPEREDYIEFIVEEIQKAIYESWRASY